MGAPAGSAAVVQERRLGSGTIYATRILAVPAGQSMKGQQQLTAVVVSATKRSEAWQRSGVGGVVAVGLVTWLPTSAFVYTECSLLLTVLRVSAMTNSGPAIWAWPKVITSLA